MNNNEIFEKFWREYQWPVSPPEPVYKLYYDDAGDPIAYTTEDRPGKYLEITAQQFAMASRRVQVRHGKLVARVDTTVHKLVPGDQGTPCHPKNVCVVVDAAEPHQRWYRK